MEPMGGIEHAQRAYASESEFSFHHSGRPCLHRQRFFNPDLMITNRLLYQLSYIGLMENISKSGQTVNTKLMPMLKSPQVEAGAGESDRLGGCHIQWLRCCGCREPRSGEDRNRSRLRVATLAPVSTFRLLCCNRHR